MFSNYSALLKIVDWKLLWEIDHDRKTLDNNRNWNLYTISIFNTRIITQEYLLPQQLIVLKTYNCICQS
jgi:hypothetical protein